MYFLYLIIYPVRVCYGVEVLHAVVFSAPHHSLVHCWLLQVTGGHPSTLSVFADKVARTSFHISVLLYHCTSCSTR